MCENIIDKPANKDGPKYFTVPDYRIYKLEDAPPLKDIQIALQVQGLKDPWIRNEIWRYNKAEFGMLGGRTYMLFFRGFKYGFAAFAATVALNMAYNSVYPENHGIMVDFFRKRP